MNQCCHPEGGEATGAQCPAPATFEIADPKAPLEPTSACDDHVVEMTGEGQTAYRVSA